MKSEPDCFIAMISDDFVYSDKNETACEYKEKMFGHEFMISSVSEPEEYYSEIFIDGINYCPNNRGINVL